MSQVIKDYEAEKEAAVKMFREIINTPDIFEMDVHVHAEVGLPMRFDYKIERVVRPIYKDGDL